MFKEEEMKHHPVLGDIITYQGMIKMCGISCRAYLLNKLWKSFAESCNMKKHLKFEFIPTGKYTEILIGLERDSRFKYFSKIIDIANNKPNMLFTNIYNLHEFIELAEAYGKLFGLIGEAEPNRKELTFLVTFLYSLFNPTQNNQHEQLFTEYENTIKNRLMM